MKLTFRTYSLFLVLTSIIMSCSTDIESVDIKAFVYSTPSTQDSIMALVLNESASFLSENPTYADLFITNAHIMLHNSTTGVTVTDFGVGNAEDGYTEANVDPPLVLPVYQAKMPENFLTDGDIIQLEVRLEDGTVIRTDDVCPQKPILLDYENKVVESNNIEGYQNFYPVVNEINMTITGLPYQYFQLEVFLLNLRGNTVRNNPVLQQQDRHLIENAITDIDQVQVNPVSRFTSNRYSTWLYSVDPALDTAVISGHFAPYGQIYDGPVQIILTPIKEEIYRAQLQTILSNAYSNLKNDPIAYPSNINGESYFGNFQIMNPIVIEE